MTLAAGASVRMWTMDGVEAYGVVTSVVTGELPMAVTTAGRQGSRKTMVTVQLDREPNLIAEVEAVAVDAAGPHPSTMAKLHDAEQAVDVLREELRRGDRTIADLQQQLEASEHARLDAEARISAARNLLK